MAAPTSGIRASHGGLDSEQAGSLTNGTGHGQVAVPSPLIRVCQAPASGPVWAKPAFLLAAAATEVPSSSRGTSFKLQKSSSLRRMALAPTSSSDHTRVCLRTTHYKLGPVSHLNPSREKAGHRKMTVFASLRLELGVQAHESSVALRACGCGRSLPVSALRY